MGRDRFSFSVAGALEFQVGNVFGLGQAGASPVRLVRIFARLDALDSAADTVLTFSGSLEPTPLHVLTIPTATASAEETVTESGIVLAADGELRLTLTAAGAEAGWLFGWVEIDRLLDPVAAAVLAAGG